MPHFDDYEKTYEEEIPDNIPNSQWDQYIMDHFDFDDEKVVSVQGIDFKDFERVKD